MATPTASNVLANEEYHLVGTFTRYSSWTARVVTVLEYFKIPHRVTYAPLSEIKTVSPTGLVPILYLSSSFYINESLSICEFLAESHPELRLWPRDRQLRALARSAAAEMHAGFSELRSFDTNFVMKFSGKIPINDGALKDIARVLNIWHGARMKTAERLAELVEVDGGFLCGEFGIVDAFYWPVLWRFRTYNLPLEGASPEALAWIRKMWQDPALKLLAKDYFRQTELPETKVEKYDNKYKDNADITSEVFAEDWEFEIKK